MPRFGKSKPKKVAADLDDSAFPYEIVRNRWLLVIAVGFLLAFGQGRPPNLIPEQALLVGLLLSNFFVAWARKRGPAWSQVLDVFTVIDLLVITVVVGWIDPTPETYLAVFAALILATALGRIGLIMILMVLVCGLYGGYLYNQVGSGLWRQVEFIVRVPFVFTIGLYFATITAHLKSQKARGQTLVQEARSQAARADHLEKEQDRLRALSQIGRIGLTAADAHPVKVLMEIAARAQKALGAGRCKLVLFAHDRHAPWNGRTKNLTIQVRTLPLGPADLKAVVPDGKLTELHPGNDKNLLAAVKPFFPDSNPFGSLLAAPVKSGDDVVGVVFLADEDHTRKFTDGERDFMWTTSLMMGAFIQARERLENELRLRALITNAPLIMFALNTEGIITLIQGKGLAALGHEEDDWLGKEMLGVCDNIDSTRKAIERAAKGRVHSGTLELDGTLFETQYSPLRDVAGEISGVMGVTTAILDERPSETTGAAELTIDPEASLGGVPLPPLKDVLQEREQDQGAAPPEAPQQYDAHTDPDGSLAGVPLPPLEPAPAPPSEPSEPGNLEGVPLPPLEPAPAPPSEPPDPGNLEGVPLPPLEPQPDAPAAAKPAQPLDPRPPDPSEDTPPRPLPKPDFDDHR